MGTNRCNRNMVRVLFIVLTLLSFNLAYNRDAYALTINGGTSYTSNPNVTLQLNMPSYTTQVAVSNEGGAATTFSPTSPIQWALSPGDGQKTVNVTYTYSQPYTCYSYYEYCCSYDRWGNCNGTCQGSTANTCYNNGTTSESASISLDARSVNTGATPVATATNPVTNKIYVVNQGSNSVTVIDGATNATATVAVGTTPQAIAINPVTNKVYVANQNSSVTVINGATNSTATIGISGTPVAIAVNSITNKIYVANQGSNAIAVIDGATGTQTAMIGVPGVPVAIAVNPASNRIYVANQSGSVTVINGVTNGVTTIGISGNPVAIAVNPATNKIYVANQGSNTVTVINGDTNSPSMLGISGIPVAIAVNPVTNKIYVATQGSNTLVIIDGITNSPASITVGTTPYAVAINQVTNKIYVTNYDSKNVTVVDGATNATSTVSTGVNPCAVGINPVTNKGYVLNKGSGNVIVVDGAGNATNTIPAGSTPRAVAVNLSTNRIYVANANSNNVTVIDGATGTPTAVGVPGIPIAVAANPVTNRIYVANQGSNTLTTIYGATNATTTIGISGIPVAIALNPVTNRIYVANQGSNTVAVIDGVTGTQIAQIGTSGIPVAVAVNPVTNRIYVVNQGSYTVTVIDGATNSTTTVPVGTNPYAVAINQITNKIYVTNQDSNNVTVIDGATNSTTDVTVGTSPRFIAVNPITNRIYVANYSSNNVTIIEGDTNSTTTVSVGTNPLSIEINPVTNKIYVVNDGSGNVTTIDGITKITTSSTTGSTPAGIAVNSVTGRIYIANSGSNSVSVITEQQSQTNPLTTSITPFTGDTAKTLTPWFSLAANNAFAPNATGELTVYYQLDTWQGPWLTTQPTASLSPGVHILYAFAADAQAATATNTGRQSSPLSGTMTAYLFLVAPGGNQPPVITEGTSTPITMSMDGSPTAFNLTLHATDNGDSLSWSILGAAAHGTATASGTGASKAISYTPNPGYVGTDSFIVQVDDGNGGSDSITVNVTVIQTYTINFVPSGTGALTGTISQTVNSGEATTAVTAVPNMGDHFVNWTGTGGFVTTTTNPLTVSNVTSAMTITANFAINTYSVTANPSSNGSLDAGTPSPATVNHGSTTSFKFNADSGYYVSGVSGCGGDAYTNSDQSVGSYTYTTGSITGDCTTSAAFSVKNYIVTYVSGGNGSLSGTVSQTINAGAATSAVTAVPSTGYHFVNWTGTGGFVTTTVNPLIITNVTADQTITANFAPDPVNGVCGTSNGGTFATAPGSNLCSDGTLPAVSGSGPWTWSCAGTYGGTTADCSANILTTANASKVLVAGGMSNSNSAPPTAEVFNQATGTWSSTLNTIAYGTIPTNGICYANMTLLGSGKALIAGGSCGGDNGTTTNATSLYDPATNLWSTGASMAYGRNSFGLVTLANGDALAFAGCAGGCSGPNVLWQFFWTVGGSAERYSSTDNSWATQQPLNTARAGLGNQNTKTVSLQDGKVLVCGGNDAFSTTYTSCEIYDPSANTWTPTSGPYPELYGPNGLVLLNNGKVLSVMNYSLGAVLFDPATGLWSATGAPLSIQNGAYIVKLSDGRVLMTGGYVNNAGTYDTLATAQIYDPTTGTWASTGSMGIGRYLHFAVLLEDGKVLAGGGVTGSTTTPWGPPVVSAEIFDPATGVWSTTGSMAQARWNNINAVRLPPPADTTAPEVTFALPANATGTTVSITTLTATDNVAVTGYCLIETDSSSGCSWNGTAPSNYTVASDGIKTLYAFAKDAAGNISTSVSATVNIQFVNLLTVAKFGSGTGTVTSSPAGIDCGASCSAPFPVGSAVVLFQTPGSNSGFSGWGDACSGTGDCAISISSNKIVTANFTSSPMVKNRRTGVAYSLLQTAHSEALQGDTIMALSALPAAGLTLDAVKNLTIEGGYDSNYASCLGLTTIFGPLTVKALTQVSGLAVKALQSSSKAITAFSFASPAAEGIIYEATHSIAITVPSGTDLRALAPAITHTGTSISPGSGTPQDFTNPVAYTVTAENLSTEEYTVTVTVAPWAVCGDVLTYAGENYPTVQIGSQCWFAKNVNAGLMVPVASGQGTSCSSIQKYCYGDTEGNCATYGGQYTWNQAMCGAQNEMAQGICPSGWHIPSDPEYVALTNYLGPGGCAQKRVGNSNYCGDPAGDRMKAAGLCQGRTPCGDSGFNGLLGGADATGLGEYIIFWTSSMNGNNIEAWRSALSLNQGGVDSTFFYSPFASGRYIRCVKD